MTAIVFDCFGVLLANTYIARYEKLKHEDPARAQKLHDINAASDKGILSRDESEKQEAALLGISTQTLQEQEKRGEHRNEELIAYIGTLKPEYKTAMLSNVSGRERLDLRFPGGELDELFDIVVASGDEGFAKPDQEIYELTAARLGISPEDCIMIDDNFEYCQGARKAGMKVIQFINNEQCIQDITLLLDRGQGKV